MTFKFVVVAVAAPIPPDEDAEEFTGMVQAVLGHAALGWNISALILIGLLRRWTEGRRSSYERPWCSPGRVLTV
jgi:hypothetical protein